MNSSTKPLASFTMPDYNVTIKAEWKPASLFNIEDDGTCKGFSDYYKSMGDAAPTDIEIPEGVTKIASVILFDKSFSGTNITSLVLPKTLKWIGSKAFDGCRSLKTIKFPIDAATGMIIELYAFRNCSSLESVELPDGADLRSNIFEGCTNLQRAVLPSTLFENIGSLFKNCSALSDVVIPEGARYIGSQTFMNCTSLHDITIPSTVETIHWYAFQGCDRINITIKKPTDSIPDAPWGATNATINWVG